MCPSLCVCVLWLSLSVIHVCCVSVCVRVCVSYGVFTPEQDNDKTNVEPVHSYDAFHTRHVGPGVKGIIGMHRFNICLVVLSLSCSGVTPSITPSLRPFPSDILSQPSDLPAV